MAKRALGLSLIALLTLCFVACDPSTEDASPRPSGTPSGSPVPTPEREGPHECRGHEALQAEVDGDDRPDLVFHSIVDGEARVGVCTGRGSFSSIAGLGQAEMLDVVDVQGDGIDEILFGSTTVAMEYLRFAVWVDDRLKVVSLSNGSAFQVHQGAPFPEEATYTFYRTSCERTRLPFGDLYGDVVEVTVVRSEPTLGWHGIGYSVKSDLASPVSEKSREVPQKGRSISEFGEELFANCAPAPD